VSVARLSRDEVVAALLAGDVVAVPTDTVYGVAARLADAPAVARLFALKSRPSHVALPIMVNTAADAVALGAHWSEAAQRLADRFWPGALTIVVGAEERTASRVGATDTIGLRAPRHDELSAIIEACGPLAVTSANEHGLAPCTSAEEVIATVWSAPLAGVLDAGTCDGAVSSVVELLVDGWRLRRRGAVTADAIEAVLGPESTTGDG
jgi:L-threonylcarbamoyladenylate synthase